MSKKRLNALLVAGCLTFLAPMSAHADDLGEKNYSATETLSTSEGGTTFSTIVVNDTDASTSTILTIDSTSTNGTLAPNAESAGSVTLNGSSSIVFSNAVNDVTFKSTIINGTNAITYSNAPETDRKVKLGEIKINAASDNTASPSLTLENIKSGDYTSIGNSTTTDTKDITLTLKNSDLNDFDVRNGQDLTVNSESGTVTIDNINVYTSNNTDNPTALKLEANGADLTQNEGKKILLQGSGSNLTLDGGNKITVQKVEIDGGSVSSKIVNSNRYSDTIIKDITLSAAGENEQTTQTELENVKAEAINFVASGEITGSENTADNINLAGNNATAKLQGITATNINLTDASNLEITGALTAANTNVVGTNSIKNSASEEDTINLGAIKVDASNNAALTLENIKANNYTSVGTKATTDTGNITYTLKSSDLNLNDTGVNASQNVTVVLEDDSQLKLQGNALTLQKATINDGKTATIVNSNTANGSKITTIVIGEGATANLEGLDYTDYTESTVGNNATINLKNSQLKTSEETGNKFEIGEGKTIKVNALAADGATATSPTTSYVADTTLADTPTASLTNTTLELSAAENAQLNVGKVTLNGKNVLNITSNNVRVNGIDVVATTNTQENTITKADGIETNLGILDLGTNSITNLTNIKKENYTELTLENTANVNLDSSDLNIGSDVTATGVNVTSTGTNNNTIEVQNTNVKFNTIVLNANSETTLKNVKAGAEGNYNSAITITSGSKINLEGSDLIATGTAQASGVSVSGTGNSISLDGTDVKLGTLSFGENSSTTLNDVKSGNYESSTIANGASVTLNSSDLKIGGDNTATASGVTVNGSTTISSANQNVNLGAIKVNASENAVTLTLDNVKNYNSIATVNNTDSQNITYDLKDSALKETTVNRGQEVTINATSGASTIDNVALTAGTANDITKLTINANGGTLSQSEGKQITLNDRTQLTTAGNNAITLQGVNVGASATTTIVNTNANTNFGALVLNNGSNTTLNGLAAGNYSSATLGDNVTVNLENSHLQGSDIASGNSVTVNATGTSTTGDMKLLAGASATDKTTLVLNADESTSSLTTGKLTLNTNSELKTDGAGKITINNIDVVGNSTINNTNTNVDTNFGNINVTDAVLTTSGVTKDIYKSLTLAGTGQIQNVDAVTDLDNFKVNAGANSTVEAKTAGVTFASADLAAGSVNMDTYEFNLTTLTLNASGGNISATDATNGTTVKMNGVTQLNVNHSGTYEVALDNIEVTDSYNGITNQASSNQEIGTITFKNNNADLILDGNSSFTVENVDLNGTNWLDTYTDTTIEKVKFDNSNDRFVLISDAGTSNINTVDGDVTWLVLQANDGNINVNQEITLNNGGTLQLDGTAQTEGTTTGSIVMNNINVKNTNDATANYIGRETNSDAAVALGDINVHDNANLMLDTISGSDYTKVTLGDNTTLTLAESELNNVELGNVATTISAYKDTNSTYKTITATTPAVAPTGVGANITLNADDNATLSGNKITVNGSREFPVEMGVEDITTPIMSHTKLVNMTGAGKVTNVLVDASGDVTLNKTNTHADSTFGQINLNGANLTVNGLNGNDHSFGTISGREITLNAGDVSSVTKITTINATNSTLANITVPSGSTDIPEILQINANDTGVAFNDITLNQNTELVLNSNGNGLTGNSIAVNGNTATSFTDNADSTQTISLLGDIKVNGTNNQFYNGTNNTVNADELVFESPNSTAVLNGDNGYVFTGGTSISTNSTLNQNSAGSVNLGNITFDQGDSFILNATNGTTFVNDFVKNPDASINATLNAAGGNIEKVTSTNLVNGDSLTLAGTNSIKMENVTVSGTGALNIKNDATDITNLTLEGNSVVDTTNGSIGKTSIDNLQVAGNGEATWKLDYDEVNKTADTLEFGEGSSVNKIKFELADRVSAAGLSQGEKYVKYIKLVNSDTSVLASTTGTHGIAHTTDDSGDDLTYYSYEDGNTKNYDANTIRVTNYKIDDDALLDKLTLQGNRDIRLTDGTHYAGLTEVTAYPNMQVKPGEETNTFVIKSVYDIDGRFNDTSDHKTQLFVVDATDANSGSTEVNRVFNIAGASMNNALSDSTVDTRDNNGAGAALYVKTNENTGSVTVNLATHKETLATPTATPTTDKLNPTSYQNTVVDGLVTELVKDVAFAQNTSSGNGGAIYNDGVKSKITGRSYTTSGIQFNSNQAGVTYTDANGNTVTTVGHGGAIYNTNGATFETKAGSVPVTYDGKEYEYVSNGVVTLTGNKATGNGGAIYNDANVNIEGNLLAANNYSAGNGGAIYNTTNAETPDAKGTVELKSSNIFIGNVAGNTTNAGHGGAIYNDNANLTLGANDITITLFQSNLATGNGGAIASMNNDLTINSLNGFDNNISLGNGGAIYAEGSTDTLEAKQIFTNNAAAGKGGAIYARGSYDGEGNLVKATTINLTANKVSTFSGNIQNAKFATEVTKEGQTIDPVTGLVKNSDGTYVVTGGESNAIYLDGDATVNLTATGEGAYVFQDKIASGNANNTINQNGIAFYNNDMSGYNGTYNLQSGHAYFTDANSIPFQGGDYILNGGTTLHLNNGKVTSIAANNLDLSGTSVENPANLAIDVNLTNGTADHFEVNNSATGNLLITSLTTQGNPNNKKSIFVPIVVDKEGNEASKVGVESVQKVYETPGNSIYDYDILGTSASGLDNGLLFKRQALDPAFRAPQVSANARLAGQLDLLNNVLHRVDEIAENRYFHKAQRNNLYAADPDVLDDSRIDNTYTAYVNQEDGGSTWTKVYGTIETNRAVAQNYRNRAYNAFFGYETPVATLKNGWDLINTVFGGYQGSFQKYSSVENHQNGGSAGYMANLYHNNFFAGGVVMMGGTNVDVNDKGKHNRDMNYGLFDIGASIRTGYNVGMGQHWLLQPMLTTSYIFVSGINRHNTQGEKYDMEGTNTLQIAPGFKLVGNYNGWQPYVLLDYTWPIVAQTNATVEGEKLEHLRLKSYLEYGVGFRKNIGERFVGHAETVVRHGGRNGISFQGGLVFKF